MCIVKSLLIYAGKRDIVIYLFSFYDIINTGRYCKLSIFFLLYLHNNNKSFAFSSIYSFFYGKKKRCISASLPTKGIKELYDHHKGHNHFNISLASLIFFSNSVIFLLRDSKSAMACSYNC